MAKKRAAEPEYDLPADHIVGEPNPIDGTYDWSIMVGTDRYEHVSETPDGKWIYKKST